VSEEARLATIVDFVEGRLAVTEFEDLLYKDPALEALLCDDPKLPTKSYVGSSVHLYLLQLDYSDPGSVLNAHGAHRDWLDRRGVTYAASRDADGLYDIILSAQPKWLRVDASYVQEQFLSRAGQRSGRELRDWLRAELVKAFRYVAKPPKWIQSPAWPVGPNGPLVFLGQVEVDEYFHDVAAVYVFHDRATGECTTVMQVA
jgi:hypothetical protein